MNDSAAFAYLMSNKSHTLYAGSTVDLKTRVKEHKTGAYRGSFTARYRFTRLVWFEGHPNLLSARQRELQIKGWIRSKKVALIQEANPNWDDLSRDWVRYLRLD